MTKLYLPTLRGAFGDWIYYSSLMPAAQVATRVKFAHELHEKNREFSDMIQRELRGERAAEIAEYLETDERFFNSLVIAVYGGDPEWHEFGDIRAERPDISISDIPDFAKDSLGFLSFSGKERMYALDGQHRLAGIRLAVEKGQEAAKDEVSVIFVAHKNTHKGMERTRRLFTTLNRRAIAVSKLEGIALDEDDAMAIITRRLVEEHPYFMGSRISYSHTPNLAPNDSKALTTISNLYDVLTVLFTDLKGHDLADIKYHRPKPDKLEEFYTFTISYFDLLKAHFPPLKHFFDSKDHTKVIARNRGSDGGHVLFRPAGLLTFTEIIAELCETHSLKASMRLIAQLPHQLDEVPYVGVLWNERPPKMLNGGRALTRRVLLYCLGQTINEDRLAEQYSKKTGVPVADCKHRLRRLRADYTKTLA